MFEKVLDHINYLISIKSRIKLILMLHCKTIPAAILDQTAEEIYKGKYSLLVALLCSLTIVNAYERQSSDFELSVDVYVVLSATKCL